MTRDSETNFEVNFQVIKLSTSQRIPYALLETTTTTQSSIPTRYLLDSISNYDFDIVHYVSSAIVDKTA